MITDWILGGGLIGLVALLLKNNKDYDDKISRSYERLDEVKKYNDEKYTNKDICKVLHAQIREDLQELKVDVKLLLKQNGHN